MRRATPHAALRWRPDARVAAIRHGALGIVAGCASLLAGCAIYHPQPLPVAPDLARAPALSVSTGHYGVRGLAPEPLDPAAGLTETNIVTLAVSANPELRAERLRAGIARAELLEAGLLPDPQISAGLSKSDFHSGYGASLDEDIEALATRAAARAAAAAHARQVNLEILWQEWQVAERARELFIRTEELAALRRVLDARSRLLGRLYRKEQRSLAQRDLTVDEVSADFAAWDAAASDARSLALEENQTRHALDALLGLAPGVRLRLRGEPPAAPLNARAYAIALRELPRRRPDLLALEAGYRSAQERLRQAILAQFPLVSAGVQKARSAEEGIGTVGFNVTVTLPLFNRNRGPIAIARATRAYLHQAYQARLDESASEADQVYQAAAIMQHELGALEARGSGLARAAAAAQASLARGELDLAGYTRVQSNSLAVRAEVIRLRAALEQAQAALGTLLALPLDGRH